MGECEMSRNGFPDCEREYNRREEAVEMARESRTDRQESARRSVYYWWCAKCQREVVDYETEVQQRNADDATHSVCGTTLNLWKRETRQEPWLSAEQIEELRRGLIADAHWSAKQDEDHWSDERINALCDMALRSLTAPAVSEKGEADALLREAREAMYLALVGSNGLTDNEWTTADGVFMPEFPASWSQSIDLMNKALSRIDAYLTRRQG